MNGFGAAAVANILSHVGDALNSVATHADTRMPNALNHNCGTDFVKTTSCLPPSLAGKLAPGQRGASFGGGASRLMHFRVDKRGRLRMLDRDKTPTLVTAFRTCRRGRCGRCALSLTAF